MMDVSQLDGLSLILGALAAGAGEGLHEAAKETATGAAQALRQGLQSARDKLLMLIKKEFVDNEEATADLNVYVRRPSVENAQALSGHILAAGLDRSEDIQAAAREVLHHSTSAAIGPGAVASQIISTTNSGSGSSHVGGVQYFGASPDPL
ncbi:hypothetical protein [Pseudarthrobacter sp. BRE9]|uniref:hypothetical protein n=1 Tax=Pseudarthrobacter sp. BRE9 TaxID=2962582 RepID=UPI0028819C2F|nr:hypothetical protein [Pseudarthrobacter sp. BRE9]MDT0169569.1 hypothetical protein [Pseudarthrobacter sp. BRE9]